MSKLSKAIHRAGLSRGPSTSFLQGTFTQSETVDSDLSTVVSDGITLRYVRKLKHVTLTSGDSVLMAKAGDLPLTIIGVLVGDIDIMNRETAP